MSGKYERYLERLCSIHAEVLPTGEYLDIQKKLFRFGGEVLQSSAGSIGSYKITQREGKRILRADAVYDLSPLPVPITTVGEYAKAQLLKTMDINRVSHWRYNIATLEALKTSRPPQYAVAGVYKDMVYIDLNSAYYTVYIRFLGIDFLPNRYFSVRPMDVEPLFLLREDKIARNSVFGFLRSEYGCVYSRNAVSFVRRGKGLFHPSLSLFTYELLSLLALELIEKCSAVYVNTDGYILPYKHLGEAMEIIRSYGFQAKVEDVGDADILGIGSYRIGGRKTKPYQKAIYCGVVRRRDLNAIVLLSDKSWLTRRVSQFLSKL